MSGLTLDPDSLHMYRGTKAVRLTKIEFLLLTHLMQSEGGFLDRGELLRRVWGPQISVEVRTVDSHMVRLRRKLTKLGMKGLAIETVWGLGYRLKTSDDRPTSSYQESTTLQSKESMFSEKPPR